MIPANAFDEIIEELERRPLSVNKYRVKTGEGRSQAFGIVGRRNLPPDYSRQCWKRPELYKMLLDFAEKYVDISYNAITLNQNYKTLPHKDKHNIGDSYLVSFGDFLGGDLIIHNDDILEYVNIKHKPMKADFSKILHSTDSFEGNRYSLVFYQFYLPNKPVNLPSPSVRIVDAKYRFYRGEEWIEKNVGLYHNLKAKKNN
jgi:hypothetical protein